MELLVTLIIGIAWPVAVIWIAHLFRSELRSLIHRVSLLKYKDIEAKFETGLAEAEAREVEIENNLPPALPSPEISSKLAILRRIADTSPRAAIMEAWVLVEESAGKSGFIQGATTPRVNPHLSVDELVNQGKLPKGSDTLLDQMRKLRNQAVHLSDFNLSQDEADRYLKLAARMSELILSIELTSHH